MQYKINDLKSILKLTSVFVALAFASIGYAQQVKPRTAGNQFDVKVQQQSDEQIKRDVLSALNDTVKQPRREVRFRIDGVSGVIGDYVILESDISKQLQAWKRSGQPGDLSECDLMESLLIEKMYAHHAIQDSITVADAEINGYTDQRIRYFQDKLGGVSEETVAQYYQKETVQQLRDELNQLGRDELLSNRMQQRLTEEVDITPEEVRQFFYNIPEDERPLFNTEVEMARIVVNAVPTEEAVQDVIDKLNQYRTDVLENGSDFAAKATLFSEDIGTERQGGVLSLKRSDPYAKEFKDATFSLTEVGQISEPFETQFGWHIVYLEKIRGSVRDVRHILLYPYISTAQEAKARRKLETMRDSIILNQISFADAARAISDEKRTAKNGGQLVNPQTGEYRLDLTRAAPDLVSTVQFMEEGDVSGIIESRAPGGQNLATFTIVNLIKKIKDHKADYTGDFLKIKELALRDKQVRKIAEWREEKLKDTYVKIGDEYKKCDFLQQWTQ
ncbi:peptidylprolyl isomerase [Nonlabens ponticola]|uniref:Peptidylprolyl isomerase n=2 Tax=Nonlabens ponticola TaxID=2496866 RepID=A0A3S9N1H2_9FLAO|nr:peptidylprolyl isomerase [Nonlabens ponticola]